MPQGKNILFVEDNTLIALDIEQMLLDAGARNVAVAGTVDAALRLLSSQSFDFAVVDIQLGDGDAEPIAQALAGKGIPFLFTTGYDKRKGGLMERYPSAPIVPKPYTREGLVAALASLQV